MWRALVLLGIAGCGRLGFDEIPQLVFIDVDATFDEGTYQGVARDGGLVQLAGVKDGVYVSRPFDASGDAVWETLAWVPRAPSVKPLVDGGGRDDGYEAGKVDMTASTLLLHLEGLGAPAQDAVVPDGSGAQHDGRVVLGGQLATHVPGVIGAALDLERDAWVSLDGTYFDFGTGDFTYAIWVRMFDCAQSNDNRIALGGGGLNDRPHMWIGALCPEACPGGDGAFMNFLADDRAGPTLDACSGVVLDDGGWHHLAGVKQGHNPGTVRLYVDGREVKADMFDFGATTHTYAGGELRLGGFNLNDPQYNTRITVDEAAIWKRALAADEVAAVYERGALRLELQVRACGDGVCDSEEFVGPDGTAATVFTEADLTGPAGSQSGNLKALGLVAPVLQYRVAFSSPDVALTPALRKVKLIATRP